jgi:tetratricopeptide (TPR) repeat protein
MRGDKAGNRRMLEASLALATEIGRADLVARSQHSLGMLLALAGDPAAGLPLLQEALAFFRRVDDRFQQAWTVGEIGQVYRLLGQHERAQTAFLEGLRMHADAGNLPGIGASLEVMASLESAAGRHATAVRLLGAAASLRLATGASAPLMYTDAGDLEGLARDAIGDDAVDRALAEGERMSSTEAVAYATGLGSLQSARSTP